MFTQSSPLSRAILRPTWCTLTLIALGLSGNQAFAADVLPPSQLDTYRSGSLSSADVGESGSMRTGASLSNSDSSLGESSLSSESNLLGEEREVLRDHSRMGLFFGASINNSVSFTLGVHGTHEVASPDSREDYLVQSSHEDEGLAVQEDWRNATKQTGFSGVSLLAKAKILDTSGFKLALAPFLESGAGEGASYTYTRSVNPKAGWMAIASYGAQGVAEITMNTGYRYRDPEVLGDITIRNEGFAGVNLSAWITPKYSGFVGVQGRSLMVAKNQDRDSDNRLQYNPKDSGEVNAGIKADLGEADLMLTFGSKLDDTNGFGFAKTTAGVAVNFQVGNYQGRRPKAGFAKQVQQNIENDRIAAPKSDKESTDQEVSFDPLKDKLEKKPATAVDPVKPAKTEEVFEEMAGKEIDPLSQLEPSKEPDLFDRVAKESAESAKDKSIGEDAIIAKELEELRAAEKVAKEKQKIADDAALAQERAQARKQLEEDAELMREWNQEASDELDKFEGISDDEMQWNGLDH